MTDDCPTGSRNFVLIKSETSVGSAQIKFWTLLMHLDLESTGSAAPAWYNAVANKLSDDPVSLAIDGALMRAGSIHVNPAQRHVIVNPDGTIGLSERGRIHFFRPNADWLFESAAASFREHTIAVVLSGNTVRPVTVAMFNFVSVEQTLWAKLAAVSVLAMLPVVVLGIFAQKHIVKGLTLGAVKGGGRR